MKITVSLHSLLLISCLCYMSWSQVCDTHIRSIIPTNISILAAMSIFRFQLQTKRPICFLLPTPERHHCVPCHHLPLQQCELCDNKRRQKEPATESFFVNVFCALDESWWRDRERGRRKKKKKKRTANIWSWEAAAFLHSLLDTNTHTLYAGSYKHTHTQIHMRTHTRKRQHTFTYQHKCT